MENYRARIGPLLYSSFCPCHSLLEQVESSTLLIFGAETWLPPFPLDKLPLVPELLWAWAWYSRLSESRAFSVRVNSSSHVRLSALSPRGKSSGCSEWPPLSPPPLWAGLVSWAGGKTRVPWWSGPRAAHASSNKDPRTTSLLAYLVLTPFCKPLILWNFCRDPVDTSGIPAGWEEGEPPPPPPRCHNAMLSPCLTTWALQDPTWEQPPALSWGFWCVNSNPPWLNFGGGWGGGKGEWGWRLGPAGCRHEDPTQPQTPVSSPLNFLTFWFFLDLSTSFQISGNLLLCSL